MVIERSSKIGANCTRILPLCANLNLLQSTKV